VVDGGGGCVVVTGAATVVGALGADVVGPDQPPVDSWRSPDPSDWFREADTGA